MIVVAVYLAVCALGVLWYAIGARDDADENRDRELLNLHIGRGR